MIYDTYLSYMYTIHSYVTIIVNITMWHALYNNTKYTKFNNCLLLTPKLKRQLDNSLYNIM